MDKIKELLKQLKATPELTEAFIKTLSEYKSGLDTQFEANIEKAKQVCFEEVEAAKAQLAQKVEVFLEARIASINREAQKQAAIGESESVKTLRGMKALLEGVTLDGNPEDNQAAVAENKKLRVMVSKLQEERDGAVAQAKRANTIATKAIQRTKILESANPVNKQTVTESAARPTGKTNLESVRTQSAKPTTRQVVNESTVKPATHQASSTPEIAAIAEGLDGSPAFARK